jgi:hypothetical protein
MKKITIVMLAFLFVGLGNVVAQTEATTDTKTEEVKKECPFTKNADGKLVCVKTGKICDEACKNKAKGTCCKGKKKTSCSKSKKSCCKSKRKGCSGKKGKYNKSSKNYSSSGNSGFNFSKKSSCSKAAKKCGDDCTKPCCTPPPPPTEDAGDENADE